MGHWWLFQIRKGKLFLADPTSLKERPTDAQESNGDVYTPWYKKEDHFDEEHIHLRAESYNKALKKALEIIYARNKDNRGLFSSNKKI